MTKISKKSAYPIKKPVVKDYFVGTDSENNLKTVNFDFTDTARLITEINGIFVANYRFKVDSNLELTASTEGIFVSEGNETNIASIDKLYINKKNFSEDNLTELFTFIKANPSKFYFKLQNSNDLSLSCYFNINNITEASNYFVFDIGVYLQNQALTELVNFDFYFFNFDLKSGSGTSVAGQLSETITVGESVVLGDLLYLNTDGKYWKASNLSSATSSTELRVALNPILANATGDGLIQGPYTSIGLTPGALYYVGVSGAITTTIDDIDGIVQRIVGTALSTTIMEFNQDPTYLEF